MSSALGRDVDYRAGYSPGHLDSYGGGGEGDEEGEGYMISASPLYNELMGMMQSRTPAGRGG